MQVSITNQLQTGAWYRYRSTAKTSITLTDARFDLGKDSLLVSGQTSNRIPLSTSLNTVIFIWNGNTIEAETDSDAVLLLNRKGEVIQNKSDGSITLVSIDHNKWAVTPAELSLDKTDTTLPWWFWLLVGIIPVLIVVFIVASIQNSQKRRAPV